MNLTTSYLGLTLKHPIVASASPLSHTLEGIKALEEAGAAAVVMYSLFEEQMSQRHKIAEKYVVQPGQQQCNTCGSEGAIKWKQLKKQ